MQDLSQTMPWSKTSVVFLSTYFCYFQLVLEIVNTSTMRCLSTIKCYLLSYTSINYVLFNLTSIKEFYQHIMAWGFPINFKQTYQFNYWCPCLFFFSHFHPSGVGDIDCFNPWKTWRSSSSLEFFNTTVFNTPWKNESPFSLKNRNHFTSFLIWTELRRLFSIILPIL